MTKKTILFVCTHNSARSQMAEGLVNALYGDQYEAYSAGIEPFQVNPFAIDVMKEIGIDISRHESKSVEQFVDREIDCVITVCDHANEMCPFFPAGKKRVHKGFKDPTAVTSSGEDKRIAFRRTRDEIRRWLDQELQEICSGPK